MHSCRLTGRAFEIYCYVAGVLLGVWIQLGLCSLCACFCACCSPIRSPLCLKCSWYKPLQLWLRLRAWLPLGLMNTLHLNLCLNQWECNLIFRSQKMSSDAWESREEDTLTSWTCFYLFLSCFCDVFPHFSCCITYFLLNALCKTLWIVFCEGMSLLYWKYSDSFTWPSDGRFQQETTTIGQISISPK